METIWHDAINKSLTPHHKNNQNPLSAKVLIEKSNLVKNTLSALVYCPRHGAPDIFAALCSGHVCFERFAFKRESKGVGSF